MSAVRSLSGKADISQRCPNSSAASLRKRSGASSFGYQAPLSSADSDEVPSPSSVSSWVMRSGSGSAFSCFQKSRSRWSMAPITPARTNRCSRESLTAAAPGRPPTVGKRRSNWSVPRNLQRDPGNSRHSVPILRRFCGAPLRVALPSAIHPALRPAFRVRQGERLLCEAMRRYVGAIRRGKPGFWKAWDKPCATQSRRHITGGGSHDSRFRGGRPPAHGTSELSFCARQYRRD
jgi:hypothetical protein